jgi:hypothetical protein
MEAQYKKCKLQAVHLITSTVNFSVVAGKTRITMYHKLVTGTFGH